MSNLAIRVEGLGKRYRLGETHEHTLASRLGRLFGRRDADVRPPEDFWALRDVSFELAQGQSLGIIGGNGAGKSTLLKILSRITQPTTGRARVRGRLASLLEVGTGFHPELTGRENVFLNGTILGMRKAEVARKFDEIVAFSGVEKFIDTPVKRYSSGMYVRLAFAVAAHLEPDVLVVDEVLAVGDAAFQQRCLGKMNDVARQGRTVLFVSHNMAAVRNLCQSALWLVGGSRREFGPADEVVRAYLADAGGEAARDGLPRGCLFLDVPDPDLSAQVLRVDLFDGNGQPVTAVGTCEDARFRITFRVAESYPSFSVELSIATVDGTTLILTKSDVDEALRISVAPGVYVIDCALPRQPLSAGEYHVGVKLAVPRVERLWFRPDLATLSIAEQDVFGSGFPPKATSHLVTVGSQWALPVRGGADRYD